MGLRLNDHTVLRGDVLMQTAVGRDEVLASAATFSRLENRATRTQARALHEVLATQFIASHDKVPVEPVLGISMPRTYRCMASKGQDAAGQCCLKRRAIAGRMP